jgi:23S rRNA-/tRNA-specific pseudouridylate synthase
MYEYLKDAFAERKVKKEYLALALGVPEKAHGFIDTPIGKSKSDFRKYATKNMLEEKPSLTEYRVLEVLPLPAWAHTRQPAQIDKTALISVNLHTGRTHQIRVHLASIGHPLMGDTLYGGKKTVLTGLSRQFLHARRIEVQLPDGTWIEAESELAEDLRAILTNLGSKLIDNL